MVIAGRSSRVGKVLEATYGQAMNETERAKLPSATEQQPRAADVPRPSAAPKKVPEIGGPSGPEPTRYGDWERNGRCIDF
jgi:hypothetical protein